MKRILCITSLIAVFITQNSFITNITPGQDEDNRKEIAKTILDNNVKEKYEEMRTNCTNALKEQLPAEKIAGVWKQLIGSEGPYQKMLSINTSVTQEGYNQVLMRCAFQNDNLTLVVTFNQDDKVIGLIWRP